MFVLLLLIDRGFEIIADQVDFSACREESFSGILVFKLFVRIFYVLSGFRGGSCNC